MTTDHNAQMLVAELSAALYFPDATTKPKPDRAHQNTDRKIRGHPLRSLPNLFAVIPEETADTSTRQTPPTSGDFPAGRADQRDNSSKSYLSLTGAALHHLLNFG